MSGFEENVAVMGEWVPCNPISSKRALERELSLNHGQFTSNNNKDSSQTNNVPRSGLGERISARAGFNTPRLNTDSSHRSPCLTISSPGLSPATLLDSPVFLSNPLAQPSPTTGKFQFLPGLSSSDACDKEKEDEFFDGIGGSFTFHPVSASSSSLFQGKEMMPIDYSNYNNGSSHQSQEEDVKLCSELSGLKRKASDHATKNTNDHQEGEEEEQRGGGAPAEDGYNWRKYGQKPVKGSEYPRSYYKCTNPNCQVRKKVERSREGHITEIIYKGAHNHSKPLPNRRSGMQVDGTEQAEHQQQVGSNDNHVEGSVQAQTGGGQLESDDGNGGVIMVDASSTFSNEEDEDDRGTHGSASLGFDGGGGGGEGDESESKRRKLEAYAIEMSGATRAIREPRVVVQTTSDVDILDDGYRWRKYGQKVVKGNPNPRSYYKCTAPGCTVRKHVERASHDLKCVITTYEGKHDHDVPAARNSSHGGGGNGNSGVSAAQTHHYQEPPRGRYDRQVNQSSQFGRPFSFQPHLGPPSGYSFGLGQTGLGNLSIPGLEFGQGKISGLPHQYIMSQPVGMSETMMRREMEPKVEPGSETGQSVYNQIMISRLPQI